MKIVVQKFGGSSVADVERIKGVAERVARTRAEGKHVVAVVSAMGDTTDELLSLAKQVCESPSRRELDMLLTAGERISMALLSMALNAHDVPAVSFTGSQSGIITNDSHSQARIVEVRPYRVQDELERGKVVIVAGYQGVSYRKEVTTLGRGGSDTTAVALAAALGAEACEIYSDVDGVYTADPRVVPASRRLSEISYEEMQELSRAGAKVLNAQAVEFAKEKGIAIYARSTFGGSGQTVVRAPEVPTERRVVGVASELDLFRVDVPGEDLVEVLELLGRREVAYSELFGDGAGQVTLLLSRENIPDAEALEAELEARFAGRLRLEEDAATVSVVGNRIGDDPAPLLQILRTVGEGYRVQASGHRITLCVPRERAPELVARLHRELLEDGAEAPR